MNRHRLLMFRHPSRNALSDAQFQAIDHFGVRILRSPQDEFVALKNVDQAGVALDQCRGEFNNPVKNFVKSTRCAEPDTDLVQYIYV